jgi:hypothetical protein
MTIQERAQGTGARDAAPDDSINRLAIPVDVAIKLLAYRDASRDARELFARYSHASRIGDREAMIGLEKAREGKRLAVDRTRRELDESVRQWGQRP